MQEQILSLIHIWQVEAQAGVVDPLTLRAISQLPNQKQLDLFVEYQRQEMTFGQLKAHLKASRPKTTADASRALQAAIRSVEEARRMDREGVPVSYTHLGKDRDSKASNLHGNTQFLGMM